MYCPRCKKYYNDDNVFCVDCGTRLEVEKSGENPMERFSTRVKSSKPKTNDYKKDNSKKYKEISNTDNKLDTIIFQNRELIKQNKRIIELLERLLD